MSSSDNAQNTASDSSTLDLAQAFKEITRGEQTAATLESNLSSLEAKLDAMLAGLEQQEAAKHNEGAPETEAEEQKEIQDEENELKMDREEDDELKAIKEAQASTTKGTFESK